MCCIIVSPGIGVLGVKRVIGLRSLLKRSGRTEEREGRLAIRGGLHKGDDKIKDYEIGTKSCNTNYNIRRFTA